MGRVAGLTFVIGLLAACASPRAGGGDSMTGGATPDSGGGGRPPTDAGTGGTSVPGGGSGATGGGSGATGGGSGATGGGSGATGGGSGATGGQGGAPAPSNVDAAVACPAGEGPGCKQAPGSTCASDGVCASGLCIDGVCCATACPVCQSCTGPGGTCRNLPARARDDSAPSFCPGKSLCDGEGRCRSEVAAACTTNDDCFSGVCAQGVCCDRACGRGCETCAAASSVGRCTPLINQPDPAACASMQVCIEPGSCATIDQTQPEYNVNSAVGFDQIAQIITFPRAGRLLGIGVLISCRDATQVVTLEVRTLVNQLPVGNVIATSRLAGLLDDPSQERMRLFAFPNPPPISAGARLGFVMRAGPVFCDYVHDTRDPYKGGYSIEQSGQQPWFTRPEDDLTFRLLMTY